MEILIDYMPMILVCIVLLIILILIVRAVFSIPKIVAHLEGQTNLLVIIAMKQGADANDVQKVLDRLKDKVAFEKNN